ncbi:MAG: hypothetical protein NTX36_12795 [Proteobacteria bacterium]|nr:hypothetical protein [Pseudomonadota bacterium]
MKKPTRHRRVNVLLCLLLCISVAIIAVLLIQVQVLKIGDSGLFFRVINGNIITLRYTHSMYGVPVTERLRVENGRLELFHVITSDAALEYFGIEGKDENNVKNSLKEFTIPAESVGRHMLSVQGHEILLSDIRTKGQKIHISIIKQPLVSYYKDSIWR